MTDEQQSHIAKITLLNTRIMAQMAQTLYQFVETVHVFLPNERLIPLLSAVEQLQASLVPVSALVEMIQDELEL
jgi:hypothetical protein